MIDIPTIDGNGHKPQVPSDYDQLAPWFAIIRHANRVIVRGAVQWTVIIAYIDDQGRPMLHGDIDILKCRELTNK